jgi:hypothetical protein
MGEQQEAMPEEPGRSQVIEPDREPKRPAENRTRLRHVPRLCEDERTLPPYSSPIVSLVAEDTSLAELVEAVRSLEYGRPSDRSVEGMLRERRGTCSTKHLFLAKALAERFPETEPQIMHRVYRLDRDRAEGLFGAEVAASVPDAGVIDVHRYLVVTVGAKRITIDVTFPGPAWDGHSPMPLSCSSGEDHPAGQHPDAEKRSLEAEHCDPAAREPFITALARFSRAQR